MNRLYEPIKNYGFIGNGRSAALISRSGSIDWLCWPRFDSTALFNAILDNEKGGYWSIKPDCPYSTTRAYVENSLVLQTTFHCESGTATLVDCMPIYRKNSGYIIPEQQILRIINCTAGSVPLRMEFRPAPEFATCKANCRKLPYGLEFNYRGRILLLRSELTTDSGDAECVLKSGESISMTLSFVKESPAILHPLGSFLKMLVDETISEWNRWAAKCTYKGDYKEQVVRSALILKALIYAPSGAIVASPTTSLPECIGGHLNWDYRYCWLRDASMTVRALFDIGFTGEAKAFASWLLHTTRLTRPRLRVFYDVYGGLSEKEKNITWLDGYGHSQPVRTGNNALWQFQLDIYGEVIDAVGHIINSTGETDSETNRMLLDFGLFICKHWNDPDEGIWEPRSGRSQHTHSKVLCWTGLNRLVRLQKKNLLRNHHMNDFFHTMELIKAEVYRKGWDHKSGTYTQKLGGTTLDMSLLLMGWHGFANPSGDQMRSTFRSLQKNLTANNGLYYRNDQSRKEKEGAFCLCSFWVAEYLAKGGGNLQEAITQFEALISYANDIGLYSEEIDPVTFEFLGNYPQTFTHIGLINAAISIEERKGFGE